MKPRFFANVGTGFVLLALIFSFEFRTTAQSMVALNKDSELERRFESREKHFFSVTASAPNQFVEIVCEQRNADVELTVFLPGGESFFKANAPTGYGGRETLAFIAPVAGEYRIELGAARPGNFAGSYKIALIELREANETDKLRAEAYGSFYETLAPLDLNSDRKSQAENRRQKLMRVGELFAQAGDARGQAIAWFALGDFYANEKGLSSQAIPAFEKSLEFWRQIGDRDGEARTLAFVGFEYTELRESKKAHEALERALALVRETGNRLNEAHILSYHCRVLNNFGEFQQGFEACRKALEMGETGDPAGSAFTLRMLGNLNGNIGNFKAAKDFYFKTLARIRENADFIHPINEAAVVGNIGGYILEEKNPTEALKYYQKALEISEKLDRPLYVAYELRVIAEIYYTLARYDEALATAERAAAIYRQYEPHRLQSVFNTVGKVYTAQNRFAEARAALREAIELNRKNKDPHAEADTLFNYAELENRAGKLDESYEALQQATRISEVARAELISKSARTAFVTTVLRRYLELEIELLAKFHEQNPTREDFVERAWQAQERIRARTLLETVLESGYNMRQGVAPELLEKEKKILAEIAVLENKRRESKTQAAQDAFESEIRALLADYEILQERFRRANPNLAAINQPLAPTLAQARSLVDRDTAILEYTLGKRQSYVWVITQSDAVLKKIAARDEINAAAREFYAALAATEQSSGEKIRLAGEKLSALALAPIAAEISGVKRLLVVADGALQIVPFAALPSLDCNATATKTVNQRARVELCQPAVSKFEIVNLPSFATLAVLRAEFAKKARPADKLLAVFADPVFTSDDERMNRKFGVAKQTGSPPAPEKLAQTLRNFGVEKLARLPFSRFEAQEIGKLAGQNSARLALGFEANRNRFLHGDFANYRILHFATHGFLDGKNADLSGLVLSLYDEKQAPQNGFLRAIDLYSTRLSTDLVVLSACQTGLGEEIASEGIVGLSRAFMYAGASSVISSLWKVDDAATAEFMRRFYAQMLQHNKTPGAALRHTQLEMSGSKRWRSPRYWAGFTLQGEYNFGLK